MPTLLQQIARKLAHSALLRKGQELWELNQNDWNLALSRTENLITVAYLVLDDYSKGRFHLFIMTNSRHIKPKLPIGFHCQD